MDYKHTLNLPKTNFAMKANLPNNEPKWLAQWQEQDIYTQLRTQRAGKQKFILHDGPPYANGRIHIGHAVNKVLKDIVVKSKSLSGFDAPYVPGWDCHGLPIELNVEKKHGKAGSKVEPEKFRSVCRDYAHTQIELQKTDFIRLGIIGDWDNPYLTMQQSVEAAIVRSLADIYKKGHLLKGYKPVHWCFDCMSSLAEAEIEYADKRSTALDVGFAVVRDDNAAFLFDALPKDACVYAVIWTTTPWTLPANQAVCVHPDLPYLLVGNASGGYLLLAKALHEDVQSRYGCDLLIVQEFAGQQLLGLRLQHPFDARYVPILAGAHVETTLGTGLVHTAPDHGVDDFRVCSEHNIATRLLVSGKGVYVDTVPVVGGMHIWQAESAIIEHLQSTGVFVHVAPFEHSYPHCWRHKTPVVFRATPQFFIKMDEVANSAYEATDAIEFFPPTGKLRLQAMLANRPDWCVSRQRYWGVPIVAFVHKQTGNLHPKTYEIMCQVADTIGHNGLESWFAMGSKDLLGDEAQDYEKLTYTLDVWYDSGTTHTSVLRTRAELAFPADVYLEGSDQHRGWFQSSLLSSVAMYDKAPYKQIITHGFVVDKQGKKMSKSIGNVISPQDIIKSKGADIVRLWVASSDYHNEITIGEATLQTSVDLYRRIRNTARFLLANLADFDPQKDILPAEQWVGLDRWIVKQAHELQQKIQQKSDMYNFVMVVQMIYNFSCNELGATYLDVIKDRQYTCKPQSNARKSAQNALYHLVHAYARWLVPFVSFTADEIYSHIPGVADNDSVLLQQWYDFSPYVHDAPITDTVWQLLLELREIINKSAEHKRSQKEIGALLGCDLTLYLNQAAKELLAPYKHELHFFFISSKVTLLPLVDDVGEPTALPSVRIAITSSTAKKCVRCWHHTDTVGSVDAHPELCARCVTNIEGEGEQRHFF